MTAGDDRVAEYVAVLRAFGLDDDAIAAGWGLDAVPESLSLAAALAHERGDEDAASLSERLRRTLLAADRGIDSTREFWDHAPGTHLGTALSPFGVSVEVEPAADEVDADFEIELAVDGERHAATFAYPDTELGENNYPALVAAVEDLVPEPVAVRLLDGPEDRWQFFAVGADALAELQSEYGDRIAPWDDPVLAERQPRDYLTATAESDPEVTPAADPTAAVSRIGVTPSDRTTTASSRIPVTPSETRVPAVSPIAVTPDSDPAAAIRAVERDAVGADGGDGAPSPTDDGTAAAAAAGEAYAETVGTGPRTARSAESVDDQVAAATEGVAAGEESVDEVFEEFAEDSPEEIAERADDGGVPSGTTGTVTRSVDDDVASLLGDLSDESLSGSGGPTTDVSDRAVDASGARIDAGGPRKVVAETSIDEIFEDIDRGDDPERRDRPSEDEREMAADAAAAAVENTLNDRDPVQTGAEGLRGGGPEKTVVEDDIDGLFDDVEEGIPSAPAEMDTETDGVDAILRGADPADGDTLVDDDVDPADMRDVNAVGGGPKRVVASESVDEIFDTFAEDSPEEIAERADEEEDEGQGIESADDEDLDEAFADFSDDVPESVEPSEPERDAEDRDEATEAVPEFADLLDGDEAADGVELETDDEDVVPEIELEVPDTEDDPGASEGDATAETANAEDGESYAVSASASQTEAETEPASGGDAGAADAPPAPESGTTPKSPGDEGGDDAPSPPTDDTNVLADAMTEDERAAADVEDDEETAETTHVGDLDISMDDVDETSVPSRTAETSDGEESDVETGGSPGSIAVEEPTDAATEDDGGDDGGLLAKLRSFLPF